MSYEQFYKSKGCKFTPMHTVEARKLGWLWRGWLPLGKLVVFDGDPGEGKSSVALDLAARLTRDDQMPDGQPSCVREYDPEVTYPNVLLMSGEEDLGDTVRPRLEALGANLARIECYGGGPDGSQPTIPGCVDELEERINLRRHKLVIIDPLMAYLDPRCKSIDEQAVRLALHPLQRMAERTGCTVLNVRHLNKSDKSKAIYKGGGSIGISAVVRANWLLGRHPEDRERRVLTASKMSNMPEPRSLQFRLIDKNGIGVPEWLGPCDLTAEDLAAAKPSGKAPNATSWLKALLDKGPATVASLKEYAKFVSGPSFRSLETGKAALGVLSVEIKSVAGTKCYAWHLPGTPAPTRLADCQKLETARMADVEPLPN